MARSADSRHRNLATPDEGAAVRQRTVLASLVGTIGHKDADRLAAALLGEFRNLGTVLVQSREALLRIIGKQHGTVADLILLSRDLMTEAMRADLQGVRIDPSDPGLRRYLVASMGSLQHETLRILFLDGSRRLIADEQLQQGTLAHLALYPRTVFRRALEHNAASILLVHNHPSGDAAPSDDDIRATRILARIGCALEVELLDHIVVTSSRVHCIGRETASGGTLASVGFTLRSAKARDAELVERALANARHTMRRRILRQQLIGSANLFGEPAWDMLIDLFVHECERKPLSVSSLCVQSSIPWSSALRLIRKLCEAGIMRRVPDLADGRRNFVRIGPEIARRMHAYFGDAGD